MEARIELLKNLLTKKRWKTVEATLYSTERDFLSYLIGKTKTCVMSYDALSECQDTLEKIGLILSNGAITSVGMMYLEGVGQLKSDPTQSIEPAHTIEQEQSGCPTVLSDCLTEAASFVKGERQESYGRMLDELKAASRRYDVEKSVHRDDGVQVGWTRIGTFRTEQDAQDYIQFLMGEKVLGQGLVRIVCEARELSVMEVGA